MKEEDADAEAWGTASWGADELDEALRASVHEALCNQLTVYRAGSQDAALYSDLVQHMEALRHVTSEAGGGSCGDALASALDALAACSAFFERSAHAALLTEVFALHAWTCPAAARGALLRLLARLVAHGVLATVCLRRMVACLAPPPAPPAAGECDADSWQPAGADLAVQDEVIAALTQVLARTPTAPPLLLPSVREELAVRALGRDAACLRLRGCLALAEAVGGGLLREGVLAAAVRCLLDLDVDIRWQDIAVVPDEEEEEAAEEEEDIFELEGQTEQLHLDAAAGDSEAVPSERLAGRSGWEGAATGAAAAAAEPVASPSGRSAADEAAERLDALMEVLFGHLGRRVAAGQHGAAWATLMGAFEAHLLAVPRSKFTQYTLWFLADKDPERCSRAFTELLLGYVADGRAAPIARSAAAAYLASFLARAAFVPDVVLIASLARLARWCLGYCAEQDARRAAGQFGVGPLLGGGMDSVGVAAGGPAGDAVRHMVFYAAVQALLYVLCYRLPHIMDLPGSGPGQAAGAAEARALRQLLRFVMPQLLGHRLAPLAVCLPTVVAEFGRLARRWRLAECPVPAPETSGAPAAATAAGGLRPLEMFFPFDPYLLRRSAAVLDLKRTYVRWRAGHPLAAAAGGSDDEEANGNEAALRASGSDEDEACEAGADSEVDAASSSSSDLSDADAGSDDGTSGAPTAGATPLSGSPDVVSDLDDLPALGGVAGSRKREASGTPGSDQGSAFLHGSSYETGGTATPPLGVSPAGSGAPIKRIPGVSLWRPDAMDAVDARDRQNFYELQQKLTGFTGKLQQVKQQAASLISSGRRSSLVKQELGALPGDTRTYQAVGRAYFLLPLDNIVDELTQHESSCTTELERLTASKKALEKSQKAVEDELRELLNSCPALARALHSQQV
ncbi:hypothetical protein WJX81_000692 [Elliptochloris bilobata]|uniref:Uncharacterized protein n=1 Tax=Elliptochloris bilobata TaxID=381761 RepID=A0AAW1RNE0_9CHLO